MAEKFGERTEGAGVEAACARLSIQPPSIMGYAKVSELVACGWLRHVDIAIGHEPVDCDLFWDGTGHPAEMAWPVSGCHVRVEQRIPLKRRHNIVNVLFVCNAVDILWHDLLSSKSWMIRSVA